MIRVYDKDLKLVALLQNAFNVSYDKMMNNLTLAEFSLPGDDPKNQYCQPFNFVEIFEGNERVDLFRIMPNDLSKGSEGVVIKYNCEHVLGMLLDDIMFKYHQTTNLSPADTISFILDFQTETRWSVGTVDFTEFFSYKWENENLLTALIGITKPYLEEFQWTWDTTSFPWTLNLIKPSNEVKSYIRYRKNLKSISRQIDPSGLVTRYYPLGYGEGDNQLTIESVNNGIPYVEAQSAYGIISDFFVDKSEENPATLKAKALAALEKAKLPQVTYKVSAADVHSITGKEIDRFDTGDLVQVFDDESGIEFCARIKQMKKPDIVGNPGEVSLEISNIDSKKISTQVQMLQKKQRITDTYSQGATNIDSNDYQDNCDHTHPATIEFYIPNECVRVNKCLLSYKTDKFRAYERSLASNESSVESSGGTKWIQDEEYTSHDSVTSIENVGTIYQHAHTLKGYDHSHDVNIPSHAHDINYGIYEYANLPEGVVIKVDGNTVTGQTGLTGNDIDIASYLSKDGSGKINRGTFHKVEIFPGTTTNNSLGLARIAATVVKQIFLQSRGEGDY